MRADERYANPVTISALSDHRGRRTSLLIQMAVPSRREKFAQSRHSVRRLVCLQHHPSTRRLCLLAACHSARAARLSPYCGAPTELSYVAAADRYTVRVERPVSHCKQTVAISPNRYIFIPALDSRSLRLFHAARPCISATSRSQRSVTHRTVARGAQRQTALGKRTVALAKWRYERVL